MAKLASRFDATAHDTEQRDYEELPNGDYELEIEASEVKEGANGTGLKTTMTVLRPEEYKGRKVFNFYNLNTRTRRRKRSASVSSRAFAERSASRKSRIPKNCTSRRLRQRSASASLRRTANIRRAPRSKILLPR